MLAFTSLMTVTARQTCWPRRWLSKPSDRFTSRYQHFSGY